MGAAAGPGNNSTVVASCLAGETAVGGGASPSQTAGAQPTLTSSWRNTANTWFAAFRNDGAAGTVTAFAFILCASP